MDKLDRVVITTSKKGKTGKIIALNNGKEKILLRVKGSTFTEINKKLRASGLIKTDIVINRRGVTFL